MKVNVLIVEDDPIIATDLELLLKKNGFNISGVAFNGNQALDKLPSDLDLVILDIHLGGGMSGITIAEIIDQKYNIPFIFLTSFYDEETISMAKKCGPYGYLVKPFQEHTLLATIKIALSNFQRKQKNIDFDRLGVRLTDQEKKICQGLYDGLTYAKIADKEYISINTVRFHVKNLYVKFDVKSRMELLNCF